MERIPTVSGTTNLIDILDRVLDIASLEGDLVLDPFGGSGSTLIACQKAGRAARLVELEPR